MHKVRAAVTLLLSFAYLNSAQDTQCHVQGQCTGLFTGLTGQESYNDCLRACQESSSCNWFTFTGHQECFEYVDSPSIDPACLDCFSGQKECSPEVATCGAHGMCEGHVIAYNTTSSEDGCLELCQQFDDCLWYSYFSSTETCVLTAECVSIDESCTDCVTGERDCYQDMGLLMVVSGGGPANFKVEVVDLTGANKTCVQIADFPTAYLSFGNFIGGKAIVCGGYDGSYSKRCYFYNPNDNEWVETDSMTIERELATGVQLTPTDWWVTGGSDGTFLSSSEIYRIGEGFSPYVDLPEVKYLHNIVTINSTHFMLLGGYNPSSRKAWMFDSTVQDWSPLPDLLESRAISQAGLVTYPDGRQAVVVAGSFGSSNSSEIFDLEEQTWRYGPDLPVPESLYGSASVQYEGTFLIVGGNSNGAQRTIYSFDPASEDWVLLDQRLDFARYDFSAFRVPSDFVECS